MGNSSIVVSNRCSVGICIGLSCWLVHRNLFRRCFTSFHGHLSHLALSLYLFVFLHSCCSDAHASETTLVHCFYILHIFIQNGIYFGVLRKLGKRSGLKLKSYIAFECALFVRFILDVNFPRITFCHVH